MENPFHYGSPVQGAQFVGRSDELRAILGRIRNHINVVLLSPRRYGKSSLLLEAERELAPEKPAIIKVNLMRQHDPSEFAGALASGAFHLTGARWERSRQAITDFVHRLQLRPSVTFEDDGRPRFQFGPGLEPRDLDVVMEDVFDLLGSIGAKRPVALILDEFQAITDLDEHLPATIKGLLDEHSNVSFVASGSKRHLMEQLFVARNAPLFNMAEEIALGPIPEGQMIQFLIERATAGHKVLAPSDAEKIVSLVGPVPDDIQHLAFESYEEANSRRRINSDDIGAALIHAVERSSNRFLDLFYLLPPGQRRVLQQLAHEPTSAPSSAEFVRRTKLANASSVSRALNALIASELVITRGAERVVGDPFFAAWLNGLGGD